MNDLISRQAAIDAVKRLSLGETDATRLAMRIGDYLERLQSAQQEQRWTPCSERLPEEEYVLISKKPSKISGDKWCVTIAIRMTDPRSRKIQWRDIGFGVIPDDNVLAWMPLPEPWKGAETC